MAIHKHLVLGGLGAALSLSTAPALGDVYLVDFPSSDTRYHSALEGDGFIPEGGQSAYLSTLGDYLAQDIVIPGFPNGFNATFMIDNQLTAGSTATFGLAFNGSVTVFWTLADCGLCGLQEVVLDLDPWLPGRPEWFGLFLFNDLPDGGRVAFLDGGRSEVSTFVPEPGVWTLMMLGFGLLGSALRRRRGAWAPSGACQP